MRVSVLFFAELKEIFGAHRLIEIKNGSTVEDVSDLFTHESQEFFLKKPSLIYAVNENFETADQELKDQDQLAIMTPMSGG